MRLAGLARGLGGWCLRSLLRTRRGLGQEGEPDRDGRARAGVRLQPDAAPMPLDQFTTHIQAEPRAWNTVRLRIVGPREPLEQPDLLVCGNANPVVADVHLGPSTRRVRADRDLDRPPVGCT
jgi:hypothetical protein